MDEELVLVLGCFTAWLLLGALALQVSANGLFQKSITFKRALITQFAMVWVLPVWTNAYFTQFTDRFIKPHPEIDFLIAFLCLIPQILIVRFSFKIPLLSAVICLIIALLPSLAAFRLAMPDHVLMGGARSYVTKAHGQMRHSTESLQEWRTQHGELPKPVNREGKDVAGSPRSAGGEGDILIYFEGPSLLPPEPFRVEGRDGPPLDPFKRSDPATYSYAAGPIHGATGRFILSSWGPDEVDQSDEVEELFLIECEGNSSRFKENDRTYRLMYSPTNGTVSQGELFWPGEVE
ncbi:MAG: hypothetical protein KC964_18425 [Candidatus Omnitrophica bacterium]|nr:hypothetical protein [Candidatus Omnitrophota bacterium]